MDQTTEAQKNHILAWGWMGRKGHGKGLISNAGCAKVPWRLLKLLLKWTDERATLGTAFSLHCIYYFYLTILYYYYLKGRVRIRGEREKKQGKWEERRWGEGTEGSGRKWKETRRGRWEEVHRLNGSKGHSWIGWNQGPHLPFVWWGLEQSSATSPGTSAGAEVRQSSQDSKQPLHMESWCHRWWLKGCIRHWSLATEIRYSHFFFLKKNIFKNTGVLGQNLFIKGLT